MPTGPLICLYPEDHGGGSMAWEIPWKDSTLRRELHSIYVFLLFDGILIPFSFSFSTHITVGYYNHSGWLILNHGSPIVQKTSSKCWLTDCTVRKIHVSGKQEEKKRYAVFLVSILYHQFSREVDFFTPSNILMELTLHFYSQRTSTTCVSNRGPRLAGRISSSWELVRNIES